MGPLSLARSRSLVAALLVVGATLAPGSAAADVTHVIGKGHTLNTIAGRYHVTARAILAANPNLNPKRLRVGDSITIPGVAPKAEKGKPSTADKGAKPAKPAAEAKPKEAEKAAKVGDKKGAEREAAQAKAAPPGPAVKGAGAAPTAFAGKPKHPNVVQFVRFGTSEEATVRVSAGGRVPPAALAKVKQIMHSSGGATHAPDPRLVALLGIVSNHFGGRKLEVVSGFRPFSPKQYTPHSNHNHGKAMDFRVQGVPNTAVRDFCRTLHNVGVGYYPNSVFVHLDVRAAPAFWIDYSRPGEAPRYHAPNTDADEGTSDVHAELPAGMGAAAPEPGAEGTTPAAPGAASPSAGTAGTVAPPAVTAPGAPAKQPDHPAPKGPALPAPSPGAPTP
ncbi:MAG: DUF882 domain-containing protein [Myxococcales bacterium]|jgi:uncharacterized protein YcbK (DUF882 family)|nr:DUF882 domain-containing protein [Myxococcales bacterium]MBL0194190.1 DUF882 domain-containing protein [Myxococcales bacterium]HQY60491.1 DUF882 domain-containing protein [Polyangiaceae bacterium]